MKNRNSFLPEHIDHFGKAQEAEMVIIKIDKMEFKELAEQLLMTGINLSEKLKNQLFDYTTSNEFVFVELVRLYLTKSELIKWALRPEKKEVKYKLPVGFALYLNEVLQETEVNIHGQTLLNKINQAIVNFGFPPDFSEM